MNKNFRNARPFVIVAAVASTLALSGCSTPAPQEPTATQAPAEAVTISDAWVKATDGGMTAGFGIVQNHTGADVTIVSATSPASPSVELHETVMNDAGQMMMSEVDGGFVIPAGADFTLEPGGNHLMLMGLETPLHAGESVTFELTLSDGSTLEFEAVVKDYAGANENYDEGDGHGEGDDHGEMGH